MTLLRIKIRLWINTLYARLFNKKTVVDGENVGIKDVAAFLDDMDIKSCKNIEQVRDKGKRKYFHAMLVLADGSVSFQRYNVRSNYHETIYRMVNIEELTNVINRSK